MENLLLELGTVSKEALIAYEKVEKWAKPTGVPWDFNTWAMNGKVQYVPKGVALIIGPFNYPLVGTQAASPFSSVAAVLNRFNSGGGIVVLCFRPSGQSLLMFRRPIFISLLQPD